MRRTFGWATLAITLLATTTGCGGGSGRATASSSSSASPASSAGRGQTRAADACGLLTAADLASVLHVEFSPGVASGEGGLFGTTCTFMSTDKVSQVSVVRFQPVGDLIKNTRSIDPTATKLAGIGDDSVYQGNGAAQLTVAVGDVGFVLDVVITPEPDQATMQALAKTIISRV